MTAPDTQCHAGIRGTARKWNFALLVDGKMKTKALTGADKPLDELTIWLGRQGVELGAVHVCVDAADKHAEGLAYALYDSVRISMVEREAVEAFAAPTGYGATSPVADAVALARYCAVSNPEVWVPPPPEEHLLKASLESLTAYRNMQDMERKNLDGFRREGMEDLARGVEEHLEWMDGAIARIDEEVARLLEEHPHLREKMQDGAIPSAGTVRPPGG